MSKRDLSEMTGKRILALFDVDGTLTLPRGEATPEVSEFLQTLRDKITVGIVGGSDLVKQEEQMGKNIIREVDYSFSENGLVAYKNGELIGKQVSVQSVSEWLQLESHQFVNHRPYIHILAKKT